MAVSICPPAGSFCPRSELEAVQGHAQEGNTGGKRRREMLEGNTGGRRRRKVQKGAQEGNAGGGHRKETQEGNTGGKRRRGVQEGNAGEKCRRGKPEWSAGGERQSGAQEGSVGGGRRRGMSEWSAGGVYRVLPVSPLGGFAVGGHCMSWEAYKGVRQRGNRHPPGGVAVGGRRMPCGASYVGVTTLIPEPPFPLLLFTKCFCVPSWSTVYTAPAWNPYSQVLICKINPLDLQAMCGEIPVILVRCWINCSAQYWKPSLFCFFFFFLHKIHTGIVYLLILFCMTRVKGIQNTLGRFSAIFKKGDSFVTSCLVSCTYKELLMLGLYHPR